ncbi:ATP-binding protein [Syntrophotalea acetylenica]|uniref:ATP-binding protein n=1 Tax=Syntrophotalea acetylenica TaxID=29542 RepID=UPI002A35AC5A|nr:ATP-binding protein [Syntrophotalea acetylenica]MDY0261904.1 ATP-binding protein [Syntrophotalea acetylenica]
MNDELIENLDFSTHNSALAKGVLTWDQVIQERATLDDIDDTTIALFKKEAVTAGRLPDISGLSTKELLKKLHLLTEEGLTHAALVLFGKDPGQFYPNLFVKIGRFGLNMVDMRFQEVCEGNLFQLLRSVMEQLEKKFLIKPIRFEGLRRIEELEYPVPALREMLLNALVHRNYMGSMTQLRVMDDRLSLWNAGTLPIELTVEKLFQSHRSIPRNPLIAEVCYRVGYIDSWGRGIEKITDACKAAGLPEPTIEENSGGVAVELMKTNLETRVKTPVETRVKTPEAILEALKEDGRLTLAEVADRIGKSVSAVERAAKKLRDQGKLKYVGPQKGGRWEVKE